MRAFQHNIARTRRAIVVLFIYTSIERFQIFYKRCIKININFDDLNLNFQVTIFGSKLNLSEETNVEKNNVNPTHFTYTFRCVSSVSYFVRHEKCRVDVPGQSKRARQIPGRHYVMTAYLHGYPSIRISIRSVGGNSRAWRCTIFRGKF